MKKEEFNKLDLREQLTDELKSKWYYQQTKWGLRVNKHSVVFNGSFKFELEYTENDFYGEEGFEDESEGCINIRKDGKIVYELFEADAIYDDEERLWSDPKDILDDIVCYIANCI